MTEDQALEFLRQVDEEAREGQTLRDQEYARSLIDDLVIDFLTANGFKRLADKLNEARSKRWLA